MIASLAGCAAREAPAPALADRGQVVWAYDVTATPPRADELIVEARIAPGSSDVLTIDEAAVPFVRSVVYASDSGWTAAGSRGPTWTVPCHERGCRVRYRVALREAATQIDDAETAIASGDALVAPPSTWLMHPQDTTGGGRRFRFHVNIQPPARFAAGTLPSPDRAADTFEAPTAALAGSSFAVFGAFERSAVVRDQARIEVAIAPHGLGISATEATGWVRSAVDAIATYYGHFPVDRALVIVQAGRPGSPTRGETLGDDGAAVLVRAGDGVTKATVGDDWVMTHELLHVTLPTLSRDHVWLSEGIPTYVEPIARARARQLPPEKVWRDLVAGLPQGLPEPEDEGLDRTHTWGRTYWGGALFCLLADVKIREGSGNARSLDDALRAVVATGADVQVRWEIARWLDVADRATGTTVLHDAYREFALAPGKVDLAALWARLGVRVAGDSVTFDDQAPLAAVRRSITEPTSPDPKTSRR